jgi:hypothetical protein
VIDFFFFCSSEGYWACGSGKGALHTNEALAADLILYEFDAWPSVDTNHENKDPFANLTV